jgi:hypothetical protein
MSIPQQIPDFSVVSEEFLAKLDSFDEYAQKQHAYSYVHIDADSPTRKWIYKKSKIFLWHVPLL